MPSYGMLKVWGCLAKVQVPLPKRTKLGPKTVDCVFIGYASNSTAYRFLVINSENSEINNNTIMESINAEFFEDIYPFKEKRHNNPSKRSHEESGKSPNVQNDQESDIELRRSKRPRKATSFGPDYLTFLSEDLSSEGEPQTYKGAMSTPEAPFWKEAVQNEIDSIMQNHTWTLSDLPKGSKAIGCKWVFKRKLKADGTIDKYKARLVAKGYRQKEGIDFFDTYSPVTRITSIRMLIAIAAIHNLEIHQMDVKTAFLNGELDEEIYMEQPEGFVAKGQEQKVCKLIKSLYGLKQAPKQ